jgi:hypothetical protein
MSLVRKQIVLDVEDLEPAVLAEIEAAIDAILTRASDHEPDPDAVGGWTATLVRELVDRLNKRGRPVQVHTLAYEAHHDGFAPRAVVYSLGGYAADRRLNGFTKPTNAIVREMIEEGLLPADATNPMEPRYDPARLSFQQAQGFSMPADVAAVFAEVLEAPPVQQ